MATEGIEEATRLLQDIRQGRGTIGKFFTDEAVYSDFSALVLSLDRVASRSPRPRHARPADQRSRAAQPADARPSQDLNAITTRIRNGEGSLGKLLNDPAMAKSLTHDHAKHRNTHWPTQPW